MSYDNEFEKWCENRDCINRNSYPERCSSCRIGWNAACEMMRGKVEELKEQIKDKYCPACDSELMKEHTEIDVMGIKIKVYTLKCPNCGLSYLPIGQECKVESYVRVHLQKQLDQANKVIQEQQQKIADLECSNLELIETARTVEEKLDRAVEIIKEHQKDMNESIYTDCKCKLCQKTEQFLKDFK